MRGQLLLVRDGLEGAVPWISQVLREAKLNVVAVAASDLSNQPPAEAVLIRIRDRNPVAMCWNLHRQGHGSVVAVSPAASSQECIRLLNAGADYYLDAWVPAPELVARVRVVLRFTGWLERHAMAAAAAS